MKDHPPRRAARIGDVARLAGVSTATVSRALSTPSIVSEETRKAVFAAVEATGYSANVLARNLRRRRTGGVMALVPNLANPFFAEIFAGMSDVLSAQDLNLIVADTRLGDRAQRRLIDYADRSRTDGLMILDGGLDPGFLDRAQCPPAIQVCETIGGVPGPRVVADNAGGTAAAVGHLADLGHRRIGRVAGPAANSLTDGREAGFRSAVSARGLEARDEWMLGGDFSLAAGQRAAERLLALPCRPTAIVCDNDEMACGLMSALIARGLRVPDDIAVVGFDDIELSRHVTPALTTIRQPRRDIGRLAARMLLEMLDGKAPPEGRTVPVELVVRGSTGPHG